MRFWENVSREMEARGISMRALARAIDVTPGAVSNYARGAMPGLDVAERIARYLECSLDGLVWGEEGKGAPSMCPSPHEHALLKELTDEFGLDEVLLLSNMSAQHQAWDAAQALLNVRPDALTLQALRDRLAGVDERVVRASLAMLRRQGVVEVLSDGEEPRYRFRAGAAAFPARELGDRTQHIKHGLRQLFRRVLPRLMSQDPHAHMTTIVARVPRDFAERVSAELYAYSMQRGAEIVEPDGETELVVQFLMAVNDPVD